MEYFPREHPTHQLLTLPPPPTPTPYQISQL